MSKVSFSKLGLKPQANYNTVNIDNNVIEVRTYDSIGIDEKLSFVVKVLGDSMDENNFANVIKLAAFTKLEILYNYTNITFTDKQKEDPAKIIDSFTTTGVMNDIIEAFGGYENMYKDVVESAEQFYKYSNSILGILHKINDDYESANIDVSELANKLSDKNNLTLLRDITNKLD